ncbi:MAG: class I SAM-dependent methyltransferase [Actinomycetota bacterium]
MDAADHVRHNRAFWDADSDEYQAAHGAQLADAPLAWGAYRAPEHDIGALAPLAALTGRRVLELGCGAGQWATTLGGRGVEVTGLDLSRAQLGHARRADADLPLVLGDGEHLPFAAGSFAAVLSDHGALSFCEPAVIAAECARVLEPGGILAFCVTHPLLVLTWDEAHGKQTRKLRTDFAALGRMDWDGEGTIDWAIPAGEWIRVLTGAGFGIEACTELVARADAETTYPEFAPPKWARRWPAEWVWRARRVIP